MNDDMPTFMFGDFNARNVRWDDRITNPLGTWLHHKLIVNDLVRINSTNQRKVDLYPK